MFIHYYRNCPTMLQWSGMCDVDVCFNQGTKVLLKKTLLAMMHLAKVATVAYWILRSVVLLLLLRDYASCTAIRSLQHCSHSGLYYSLLSADA